MPILVNENGSISGISETLHLRSNEVQEFISRKPNFFIRWGTVLFFCILVVMGIVCWFIQYPDLVVSKARLTSMNAPKEVITKKRKGKKNAGKAIYKRAFLLKKERRKELSSRY